MFLTTTGSTGWGGETKVCTWARGARIPGLLVAVEAITTVALVAFPKTGVLPAAGALLDVDIHVAGVEHGLAVRTDHLDAVADLSLTRAGHRCVCLSNRKNVANSDVWVE